jgi:predicted ATPase/class 3 adenylate cyclase
MAAQWRITLLGGLRAEGCGRVITRFRTQKTGALLAYLAYHLPRSHPRDLLIELLWPEANLEAGSHSLSTALTWLRRLLEGPGRPPGTVLVTDRASVRLNAEAVSTDLAEFEAALHAAAAGSEIERREGLARAVTLYRGELLAGSYESWVLGQREWLAETYFQAVSRLVALVEGEGDLPRALEYARQGVLADPLREEGRRDLMRLYAAAGQPEAALRQYGELERLLKEELDAQPSGPTRALARQIEADPAALLAPPRLSSSPASEPSPKPAPIGEAASGTRTFLLTDVEGSTSLWEEHPEAMAAALARHDALAASLVAQHAGTLVKHRGEGDSLFAVFPSAGDGVAAALALQRALGAERRPEGIALRVRMALHTGDAVAREGDYVGGAVNRCARLRAAAHGGQVLLSRATQELVADHLPEGVSLRDLGECRLKDLVRPERVFQLRHAELPADFPPLQSLATRPNNLPAQPTPLIGREVEQEAVRRLLGREEVRLVTLTGPGGTGKTRLGLQVAAELLEEFADGVFFVDLAPIRDPELVVGTIAQALGVRGAEGRPLGESLKEYLREKQLLLLLDNFEQVIAAAPRVAEPLAGAPRLKVLVTSRAILRIRGEHDFPVPPLALPDRWRLPNRELLSQYAAVALFIQRAAAARPEFAVTNENAQAVAEICHRLDGLPLAIELAAARVRLLSPEGLLSRLEQRLPLLVGGARDLPERQRTLRDTIGWSYDLLSEGEQRLFRRLSVFVGGCTLGAAEAVCSADGDLQVDVLSGIGSLVDQSLLRQQEPAVGGSREVGTPTAAGARSREPRFEMLETIREYAREQLEEDPHVARDVASRHAWYYLQFAEARATQIRTRAEAQALDELSEELDNLRAAMDWAQTSRQGELCARLALALFQLLYRRGFWEEARWRLQVARAAIEEMKGGGAALSRGRRVSALSAAGAGPRARGLMAAISQDLASLAEDMGDLAEARRQAERSLALRSALNDPPGRGDALNLLGHIAMKEGDLAAAQNRFDDALQLLAEDDHIRRGVIMHNVADLAARRGDADAARRLYRESLAHLRTAGDPRDEARLLGDFGALSQECNEDPSEAHRLYQESLALYRELGDRHGIAVMLNNLGELAEVDGDRETAAALFLHAERIFRDLQSAFVSEPAGSLQRLAERVGPERWPALRAAAEQASWEDLVTRLA